MTVRTGRQRDIRNGRRMRRVTGGVPKAGALTIQRPDGSVEVVSATAATAHARRVVKQQPDQEDLLEARRRRYAAQAARQRARGK